MPYHDWQLVKGPVSGSPLISAVVKINILGVRLKVGHGTHGISLFSIYTWLHAEPEDMISDATHGDYPTPFPERKKANHNETLIQMAVLNFDSCQTITYHIKCFLTRPLFPFILASLHMKSPTYDLLLLCAQ